MLLSDVANSFNDMVCLDGYTGVDLFRGQLSLYDDNKRDSETAERRVISVAPSVTPPARRVIAAAGTRFILGHANPDDYRGETIRVGYVVHEAPFLSQVRTLAQVCLGQAGFTAYAGRAWVKDTSYSQQDSKEIPQHHIHYSSTESIVPNLLVTYAGRLNIVRSLNYGAGGTIVAACEEMGEPSVEAATLSVGTYDPVLDVTTATPISVTVVRMRWQALFAYLNSMAPKFEPGDIQVAIAKSVATVTAGATLALSDGSWRVQSALSEGGVWLCRATRYA